MSHGDVESRCQLASKECLERIKRRQGGVLVEFAVSVLALWVLVAGIVELGRALAISHVLQNASRQVAREMALMPEAESFTQALGVVYDPAHLVIDVDCARRESGEAGLEGYISDLPMLNRDLAPVMILDEITAGAADSVRVLRYPGTILTGLSRPEGSCNRGLTVGIPRPREEDENRFEWAPVVEEVPGVRFEPGASRADGIAAVRINYPFQSVAFAAWKPSQVVPGSGERTTYSPVDAGAIDVRGTTPHGASISGPVELGQLEMLGRSVRPYRRVLSGQAAFRRELVD